MESQPTIKSRTTSRMLALAVAASCVCTAPFAGAAEPVHLLSQNWKQKDWQWFYSTTQGSELLDYAWFRALERPRSQTPFLADSLTRFGYLPNGQNDFNPDGLPVGFTIDKVGDYKYLGLTCAACHTGQVEFGGTLMQIDGAPSRGDLYSFLVEMRDSLQETGSDEAKFARFADKVLGSRDSPGNRRSLRDNLAKYKGRYNTFIENSPPPTNQ